jgi:protein-disulfide isomerase
MRGLFIRSVAVAAALTLGACGSEAPDAPDTSSTTAGLLSGSPRGASTLMGDPNLPQDQGQNIDLATLGYDRGDPESPIRMLEMSDYGCGYCRQFHMETFPVLLADFVPYITGMFDTSLVATEGAECALDQSREVFAVLNERLWTDQSDWKRSDEPAAVVRTMAGDAGVDLGEFDACLADDRRIDRIAAATALAQRAGVRGTPTFFIMGYPPLQGALPTESFVQILTQVYAEATQGAGS